MRQVLNAVSDRALALFLPKARAGACPCQPGGEGHYQTRCVGHLVQRRWCVNNCNCTLRCGSWQMTMTIC